MKAHQAFIMGLMVGGILMGLYEIPVLKAAHRALADQQETINKQNEAILSATDAIKHCGNIIKTMPPEAQ